MSDKLLTTKQVAEIHGIGIGSVIKWITAGDLKAKKIGRDYLIKESDAKAYKRRPITGRPPK